MSETSTAIAVQEKPSALQVLLADPDRLKDFPVATVERLYTLHKDMQADQAKREFSQAFNRVQKAMAPVRKLANNTQTGTMYARAEDVTGMLDPLIIGEGFSRSLSTTDCPVEGHIRFVLILRHNSGHEERHNFDAPPDYLGPKGSPTKTKLHGMASSYTYCERHLLCKVFGVQLVADDDGNAGGGVGPGAEKITEEQALDLEALLSEVKGTRAKFLDLMGVSKLEDLARSQHAQAVRFLEAKRK